MPPYSKLKEYVVGGFRAIVDDPATTTTQRLSALKSLEKLQVKRKRKKRLKLQEKPKWTGAIGRERVNQILNPAPVNSKLLGIVEET